MSSPADTFSPLSKSPTLARARTRTNTSLTSHSSASTTRNGIDHPSKPLVDPALLPKSNSPTLRLVQCTPAELLRQQKANSLAWRGSLSLEQYLRRESILANQDLTRDGGMSFWILTDDNLPRLEGEPWRGHSVAGGGHHDHRPRGDGERIALAGCESIRKRAFLRRKGDAD
ncbi:MAG: hypothetical protein INR71_03155, partial [Terriglobus roseus]|nr:hypothetical protein [Terriglobus roseus]